MGIIINANNIINCDELRSRPIKIVIESFRTIINEVHFPKKTKLSFYYFLIRKWCFGKF